MYGKHLLFQEKKRLTFVWKNIWHDLFHLFCLISVQTGVYAQNKGKISPHVKLKNSRNTEVPRNYSNEVFCPHPIRKIQICFLPYLPAVPVLAFVDWHQYSRIFWFSLPGDHPLLMHGHQLLLLTLVVLLQLLDPVLGRNKLILYS